MATLARLEDSYEQADCTGAHPRVKASNLVDTAYEDDPPPPFQSPPSPPVPVIPFTPFPRPPISKPWELGYDVKDTAKAPIPTECPKLVQPKNIHFMVINLDRSINRLQHMREVFRNLSLPDFERYVWP